MNARTRLEQLRQLTGRERRALIEASSWVVLARIAIATLPFRTAQGLSQRLKLAMLHHEALRAFEPMPADLIAEAIERAGRHVPGSRCLHRALAGSIALAHHGHDTRLRIGVRRPLEGPLEAHAWLEDDTGVRVGGPIQDFAAFPPLD